MESVGGDEAEIHSVRIVGGNEVKREERNGEDGDEAVDSGTLVGRKDLPPPDGAVSEDHGHVERNHGCENRVEVVPRNHLKVGNKRGK